jgi:hypothetical protein
MLPDSRQKALESLNGRSVLNLNRTKGFVFSFDDRQTKRRR